MHIVTGGKQSSIVTMHNLLDRQISNLVTTWFWVDYVIIKFTFNRKPEPAKQKEQLTTLQLNEQNYLS